VAANILSEDWNRFSLLNVVFLETLDDGRSPKARLLKVDQLLKSSRLLRNQKLPYRGHNTPILSPNSEEDETMNVPLTRWLHAYGRSVFME
jgi:hypothetical protein